MFRDADIRRTTQTKAISDFLRGVMPYRELSSPSPEPELNRKQLIVAKVEAKTPPPLSPILRQRWRHLNEDMMMMTLRRVVKRNKKNTLVPLGIFSTYNSVYVRKANN